MSRVRGISAVLAVGALALAACGGGDDDDASPDTSPDGDSTTESTAAESTSATAEDLCADDLKTVTAGKVAQPALTEVSGIAESRRNPGVLWAHNDSGGDAEVFALADDGAALGRFRLEGAEAYDWEDMALGADHLYMGDIGDNQSSRDEIIVYRVAEPTIDPASPGADQTLTGVDALTLTYADGPHDAETLLADPTTGDLFVVSKQWDGKISGLYRVPADAQPGTPVVMERVADVAGSASQFATGGDIAADGSLVILRTYGKILVWDRAEGQTVAEAVAAEPCEAAVPWEIQGEAIAFTPDGKGYTTIAEGEAPDVNRAHL